MPKQYGPLVRDITWASDPDGGHKILDSSTGMEVAVVMKVWLDGLLASPASVRQEDLDSYSRVIEDLRQKLSGSERLQQKHSRELSDALIERNELRHALDREIAVSRQLAVKLEASDTLVGTLRAERTRRQEEANAMAHAFMELHNMAKKVVGPPARPPLKAPAASMSKAQDVAAEIAGDLTGRPTFGEMLKAAEAGDS